jgi:orotate phosphoribosyltransferase
MRDELLKMLKEKAYRKGEFKLSSGDTSEHYVNCKPVILNGEGLYMVCDMMLGHIEHDSKAVAGLTLGADPLVSGLAMHSYSYWNRVQSSYIVDGLIIRKEPKGHGTASQIEGPLPPKGSKITVLEDVVTTGGSSIKAVNVLRDVGYEVNRVISIVDRQEGGVEAMKDVGLELKSLFTMEDFINEI